MSELTQIPRRVDFSDRRLCQKPAAKSAGRPWVMAKTRSVEARESHWPRPPGLRGLGVFGAIAPGLGLEAAHVELASGDAELGAQDQFFVGDELAVFGLDPVVAAVVGDVDDLLAKAEIGAYLPRARIALVKLRVRGTQIPDSRRKNGPGGLPSRSKTACLRLTQGSARSLHQHRSRSRYETGAVSPPAM
jgi:hypothetical protein